MSRLAIAPDVVKLSDTDAREGDPDCAADCPRLRRHGRARTCLPQSSVRTTPAASSTNRARTAAGSRAYMAATAAR